MDVPPRSWTRILTAAESVCAELLPDSIVALRFVSDTAIRELNRGFLGLDRATDVLSFPSEPEPAPTHGRKVTALALSHAGDIAVSWDTARRQALANGNSLEDECIALITHGLLHLAGYDHETDADEAEMQQRAERLLARVGVTTRVYGH